MNQQKNQAASRIRAKAADAGGVISAAAYFVLALGVIVFAIAVGAASGPPWEWPQSEH